MSDLTDTPTDTPTATRTTPTIVSVNVSTGGIPKWPVETISVGTDGLAGDGHNHEKHVTPQQAVSLFDLEDLRDLRREGYDVGPGSTGENLTVLGLSVDELHPGDRLVLSGGVSLEITRRRNPCFVLDAIDPRLKIVLRGRCGFYARVTTPGRLRPGETISVTTDQNGETRWPHTAAILAGGKSRRMGRAKALLTMADGRTLIETVAAAAAGMCNTLVVVGPADVLPSAPHLDDLRPGQGPLAGIEALLASGLDTEYLVCPCDLPRVSREILVELTRPSTSPATVLHIDGEDRPRPLPARLSADLLPVVRRLLDRSERSVHGLLAELEADVVEAPAEWVGQLANVNTPQEYEQLQEPSDT